MGPPLQAAPSPVEPPSVRVIESEPVTTSIIVEEEVIDIEAKEASKESELNLLKHLINFPGEVESAASERAPYKITNYIHKLAELVHAFYTECRVINRDDINVTASRLALCKSAKTVLKNALNLIGVNAPDHM